MNGDQAKNAFRARSAALAAMGVAGLHDSDLMNCEVPDTFLAAHPLADQLLDADWELGAQERNAETSDAIYRKELVVVCDFVDGILEAERRELQELRVAAYGDGNLVVGAPALLFDGVRPFEEVAPAIDHFTAGHRLSHRLRALSILAGRLRTLREASTALSGEQISKELVQLGDRFYVAARKPADLFAVQAVNAALAMGSPTDFSQEVLGPLDLEWTAPPTLASALVVPFLCWYEGLRHRGFGPVTFEMRRHGLTMIVTDDDMAGEFSSSYCDLQINWERYTELRDGSYGSYGKETIELLSQALALRNPGIEVIDAVVAIINEMSTGGHEPPSSLALS